MYPCSYHYYYYYYYYNTSTSREHSVEPLMMDGTQNNILYLFTIWTHLAVDTQRELSTNCAFICHEFNNSTYEPKQNMVTDGL